MFSRRQLFLRSMRKFQKEYLHAMCTAIDRESD